APLIINFEKLRTLIGVRHVRLASEEEMTRLYPDCEVGAVPPLGPLYKQRVCVDRRLVVSVNWWKSLSASSSSL
ncbi:MAG: YbaK/EbsC family protein, partial [Acidobacteria bacterium]